MKPALSILDPSFRYSNSACTEIRLTFQRERQRLQAATQAKADREAKDRAQAATDTQRIVDITNARRAGVKP